MTAAAERGPVIPVRPRPGRSSVAVSAGIWPDGGFVAPGGDRITSAGDATGLDGWS